MRRLNITSHSHSHVCSLYFFVGDVLAKKMMSSAQNRDIARQALLDRALRAADRSASAKGRLLARQQYAKALRAAEDHVAQLRLLLRLDPDPPSSTASKAPLAPAIPNRAMALAAALNDVCAIQVDQLKSGYERAREAIDEAIGLYQGFEADDRLKAKDGGAWYYGTLLPALVEALDNQRTIFLDLDDVEATARAVKVNARVIIKLLRRGMDKHKAEQLYWCAESLAWANGREGMEGHMDMYLPRDDVDGKNKIEEKRSKRSNDADCTPANKTGWSSAATAPTSSSSSSSTGNIKTKNLSVFYIYFFLLFIIYFAFCFLFFSFGSRA